MLSEASIFWQPDRALLLCWRTCHGNPPRLSLQLDPDALRANLTMLLTLAGWAAGSGRRLWSLQQPKGRACPKPALSIRSTSPLQHFRCEPVASNRKHPEWRQASHYLPGGSRIRRPSLESSSFSFFIVTRNSLACLEFGKKRSLCMFRLVALVGLAWLGCRILQENARHDPVALIPSPARMRRQVAEARLRSAAAGRFG